MIFLFDRSNRDIDWDEGAGQRFKNFLLVVDFLFILLEEEQEIMIKSLIDFIDSIGSIYLLLCFFNFIFKLLVWFL